MENLEFYNIIFQDVECYGIWGWIMESHGKWLEMAANYFSENKKARNTLNEWSFSYYSENTFSILGHGKHQKVLERSWKVMEFYKIERVRTL